MTTKTTHGTGKWAAMTMKTESDCISKIWSTGLSTNQYQPAELPAVQPLNAHALKQNHPPSKQLHIFSPPSLCTSLFQFGPRKASTMASLSFIVGLIGNVISILVFASPIATFKRVVKKKSIENYKGLPYVCTLLSTSMWTFYGLLKPGGLLIVTVNGAGAGLEAIYVTLYIIFAPKDTRVKMIKLVALLNIGSLGVLIAVTLLALHGSLRLLVIGFMCAGLTLGMYASPMVAMRTVIVTKSVEYMPFSLSFFLFLNGGVWSVYAALVKDYFIGVPNVIGFFLGSAQLVLYAVYRRKKPTPKPEKDEEELGSAHLVRDIEMKQGEEDDEESGKSRALHKGRSLPKQGPARQFSLKKIVKANSLNPYELQALRADVENGQGP